MLAAYANVLRNYCNEFHLRPISEPSGLSDILTLKAPITTAADDIHKYFFYCFSEKIGLDVSCESSARQRIHLKHQALFSLKDKSKTK